MNHGTLNRRSLLAGLAACSVLLWGCKGKPVQSPETRHRLYDKAWQWGRRDRLLGLSANSSRYANRLADHQPPFEKTAMLAVLNGGYSDGFEQHPEEPMGLAESEYDQAYRAGQLDAWNEQSAQHSTPGYVDGLKGLPHLYGRPY